MDNVNSLMLMYMILKDYLYMSVALLLMALDRLPTWICMHPYMILCMCLCLNRLLTWTRMHPYVIRYICLCVNTNMDLHAPLHDSLHVLLNVSTSLPDGVVDSSISVPSGLGQNVSSANPVEIHIVHLVPNTVHMDVPSSQNYPTPTGNKILLFFVMKIYLLGMMSKLGFSNLWILRVMGCVK
ncbi:hypothetical protein ACOSQ3_018633 [Xanthoceras sorbifolium]